MGKSLLAFSASSQLLRSLSSARSGRLYCCDARVRFKLSIDKELGRIPCMKQELCAYLVRGDGCVWQMPTDKLLIALDPLMQAGIPQGQSISCDKAAVYEFLQTLKWTMRTPRDAGQASRKEKGKEMGNMTREEAE